ncbi:MAG: hypothetical protein DU429_02700 [Candidatus Tokpelaia sp.]|nr:MAG: hypothetical protein DU430_05450 [Candidatus Tokpelaia sp.]KAA6207381.1 MAG: hypothetical protein DU429_02700 [Candidatus Tokpelaia sp.]
MSEDLLCVAEDLINPNSGTPRQAHLRRAVSSVYYALFHFLAQQCADNFIGAEPDTKAAWRQVYRALDHGAARKACEKCPGNFPDEIKDYAALFGTYQGKRHEADYDPFTSWSENDVTKMVKETREILENFERVDIKHRKAFSAFVLLKKR